MVVAETAVTLSTVSRTGGVGMAGASVGASVGSGCGGGNGRWFRRFRGWLSGDSFDSWFDSGCNGQYIGNGRAAYQPKQNGTSDKQKTLYSKNTPRCKKYRVFYNRKHKLNGNFLLDDSCTGKILLLSTFKLFSIQQKWRSCTGRIAIFKLTTRRG